MKTVIQLLIVLVLLFVAWKWWQKHQSAPTAAAGASASQECAAAAAAAGETWGSGVGRFANPPYDTAAWDDFRSRVGKQARQAQEKWPCGDAACKPAEGRMGQRPGFVHRLESPAGRG